MSKLKDGVLHLENATAHSRLRPARSWCGAAAHGSPALRSGLVRLALAALAVASLPTLATSIISTSTANRVYFQHKGGLVESWSVASNGAYQATAVVGHFGAWQLKTAGDIDGDGVNDLVFQPGPYTTAVLFMTTQSTVKGTAYLGYTGSYGEVKACADYEGLGHAQLFFQTASGDASYWRLGTDGGNQATFFLGTMSGWQLCSAGDIDGDHKAELVWQNASGDIAIWYHNPDGSIRASLPFSSGAWVPRAMLDLDGDGVSDLLWQTPDRNTSGWFLNSNGTARSAFFMGSTGNWVIKAAGHWMFTY